MHLFVRRFIAVALVAFGSASGCSVVTDVAAQGADFGGATADAHCDRRDVTDGGEASAFCQEVVATVAASQFSDDCRMKHQATPGPGLCPRAKIIAGCKLLEKHGDGSIAWDWYYDVSGDIAEAGAEAGPGGGPTFASPVARTVDDVRAICADRTRYNDGAELVLP
jgi:hypothetical protein